MGGGGGGGGRGGREGGGRGEMDGLSSFTKGIGHVQERNREMINFIDNL